MDLLQSKKNDHQLVTSRELISDNGDQDDQEEEIQVRNRREKRRKPKRFDDYHM